MTSRKYLEQDEFSHSTDQTPLYSLKLNKSAWFCCDSVYTRYQQYSTKETILSHSAQKNNYSPRLLFKSKKSENSIPAVSCKYFSHSILTLVCFSHSYEKVEHRINAVRMMEPVNQEILPIIPNHALITA